MTLPLEYMTPIIVCGKCELSFFLDSEDETMFICPLCKTVHEQKDGRWTCEFHLTLNLNSIEIPYDGIIIPHRGHHKDITLSFLIERIKKEGLHPILVRKEGPKRYVLIYGLPKLLTVESMEGGTSIHCLILPEPERLQP